MRSFDTDFLSHEVPGLQTQKHHELQERFQLTENGSDYGAEPAWARTMVC